MSHNETGILTFQAGDLLPAGWKIRQLQPTEPREERAITSRWMSNVSPPHSTRAAVATGLQKK